MLAERLLVTIVLVPLGVGVIALGGPAYAVVVTLIIGLAAWEYWRMFRACGAAPSAALVIGGAGLLVVSRTVLGFTLSDLLLALLILVAMAYHLVEFERGRLSAGADFGVTLGGAFYLGWIGAYLISLRDLPAGQWWLLLALPAVWVADSGAMLIGSRFGKHKLAPRLSPKKTWEGYFGGILFGTLGAALLAALWHLMTPAVTPARGALLGLILSILTPLGDLGESMFKRQAGLKDSSNLIPGHGGVFDRIDSWLWAGVIGYYVVMWLW